MERAVHYNGFPEGERVIDWRWTPGELERGGGSGNGEDAD